MNFDFSKLAKAVLPVVIATIVSVIGGLQIVVPKAIEETDALENSTEASVLEHARALNAHAKLIEELLKQSTACREDNKALQALVSAAHSSTKKAAEKQAVKSDGDGIKEAPPAPAPAPSEVPRVSESFTRRGDVVQQVVEQAAVTPQETSAE